MSVISYPPSSEDQFPAHVAAARKHYLQVTEDHFKQAAQNAVQKSSEMGGNDRKEQTQSKLIPLQVPVLAGIYWKIRLCSCHRTKTLMGDTGLELYPYSTRNTRISKQATHNPTHRLHQTAAIPPDLQRVIKAWPALPTAVRHSLLTIIDAVAGHSDEAPG